MSFDFKAATPDTSVTDDNSGLFGADSQTASSPSWYSFGTIKAYLQSFFLRTGQNLADIADVGAARNNMGGIFPICDPDFNDSNVYLTTPCFGGLSGGGMAANRFDIQPIWVPRTRTYTTYGIILTALSGTSGIRVALYADNNGSPGAKIDEGASAVDASTATGSLGKKSIAFTANQTLKPGLYWLAVMSDGAPSAVRIANNTSSALGISFGTSAVIYNGTKVATSGVTYPTFPPDAGALSYVSQASLTTGSVLVGIR